MIIPGHSSDELGLENMHWILMVLGYVVSC